MHFILVLTCVELRFAPVVLSLEICPVSLSLCLPTGTAQFQSCYDTTGCGGNVSAVSNASDCCLGSGLSFRDGGTCRQCIGKLLIIFLKLLQSK